MEIEKKERKEKKDRWWILEVFDFFFSVIELVFYLPRLVFRFLKDW